VERFTPPAVSKQLCGHGCIHNPVEMITSTHCLNTHILNFRAFLTEAIGQGRESVLGRRVALAHQMGVGVASKAVIAPSEVPLRVKWEG